MKILQINTTINTGSTGRIAEEIGQLLISNGHQSYIAFGRGKQDSKSIKIKIGNKVDQFFHLVITRLFDRHGFGSKIATKKLVKRIKAIKPDLIHLHNLHGYYLNIAVLFNFLKEYEKPVVWTLHDAWAFTGHCTFFDRFKCEKWQTECNECPIKDKYPASFFLDNSKCNFKIKKKLFTAIENLTIVTPSNWLAEHVKKSFLREYDLRIINNGVDTRIFKPLLPKKEEKFTILGVANTWDKRKGLDDFFAIGKIFNGNVIIKLIGLNKNQINELPENIIGISRTNNINELAENYSQAYIFVNPTYIDNFPTTNIEALSCGTPLITYNTGGSPEAIDENTGIVVEKGNIEKLVEAIETVKNNGKEFYSANCRNRAEKLYNKNDRYKDYIDLYRTKIN